MAIAAIPIIASVVSAGAAAAGAAASASASSRQADVATQVANYNAKVDQANAEQLAMNANANIQKQRLQDKSYLSSQEVAYAASGILSGTGSPMALQATTAGRQEQDISQYWQDTQTKESDLYEAAQLGVYEGAQEADTFHLQGAADIFQGIGSVDNFGGQAATRYGEYQAGKGAI